MDSTVKDMKVLKFEALVEEIWKHLPLIDVLDNDFYESFGEFRYFLGVFFYKDIDINRFEVIVTQYDEQVNSLEEHLDWLKQDNQLEIAKLLKNLLNKKEDTSVWACVFIFWALMLLSVNKTNETERLSLICDLARILKVTDDEVMDIVQVIKVIYQETETPVFRSEAVPSDDMFGGVIRHFLPNWHM